MNNNYLLMCGICSLFVDAALETPCCKHLFCAKCISCWLEQSTKCPHCKDALCLDNLVSPHTIVADIIKQSVLKCDFYEAPLTGCPVQVRLCDLKSHVENCSHNFHRLQWSYCTETVIHDVLLYTLQEKVLSDLCSAPAHVISKRAEASAEGASAGQRDQMTCLVQVRFCC